MVYLGPKVGANSLQLVKEKTEAIFQTRNAENIMQTFGQIQLVTVVKLLHNLLKKDEPQLWRME